MKDRPGAAGVRHSKRFAPSAIAEKLVPALLVLLLLALLVVLVIIGLSLFAITPAA